MFGNFEGPSSPSHCLRSPRIPAPPPVDGSDLDTDALHSVGVGASPLLSMTAAPANQPPPPPPSLSMTAVQRSPSLCF